MHEKIAAILRGNLFLPAPVKALLLEVGAELDRLRAEVDELRSSTKEKE